MIPESVIENKVSGWLRFELVEHKAKTCVWDVLMHPAGHKLGVVKWFAHWRKYAFFPENGSLFEQDCMTAIGQFLVTVTTMHNNKAT